MITARQNPTETGCELDRCTHETESDTHETVITNVSALVGQQIIESAVVAFSNGVITEVKEITSSSKYALLQDRSKSVKVIDGALQLLTPGFVDSHSDGLEKAVSPRRGAQFDLDFALKSFEAQVRSCGITTLCHGVAYQDVELSERSIANARATVKAITKRNSEASAALDHKILFRVEARDPEGITSLIADIDSSELGKETSIISYEDHTPGQGQYRDPGQYVAAIDPESLPRNMTAEQYVADLIAKNEALIQYRETNQQILKNRAQDNDLVLLGHDLDSQEQVLFAKEMGATVAEFPVSEAAARAAREVSMTIVMGAPNALRGYSHNGNTSAREMISKGLCDVLASDYMPASLLGAVTALIRDKVCSVTDAFSLITSRPSQMLGLQNRGRIEAGLRSDLVLIDNSTYWPVITRTISAPTV